jgi:undecaprenyl phosphate-alpha-L-ara4FN deformylase
VTSLALKVDADTWLGTRDGVPRLAALFERCGVGATFLFSVGPDHTGRALRRVFRRGFLGKVRRTSVVSHYGIRTLLYGTLLPGPNIGRRCRAEMRAIAAGGFEVGLHSYDHVRWQDGVAHADRAWTRGELERGCEAFAEALGTRPRVHGAAGWQANAAVPALERDFGFVLASDTRGTGAFVPVVNGREVAVPQLPTTLPTLDELIGRPDLGTQDPVDHLLSLTEHASADHVFTLHAELEGGRFLGALERLITGWKAQGYLPCSLSQAAARLDVDRLPRCAIASGEVPGRSGTLAVQGALSRPGSGIG